MLQDEKLQHVINIPSSRADVNTGEEEPSRSASALGDSTSAPNSKTSADTDSQKDERKNKQTNKPGTAEDSQDEFERKNEETIKRLKLEIDLEIETQQGRLDDHQSTVTHDQYSASSPTHAHTRAIA